MWEKGARVEPGWLTVKTSCQGQLITHIRQEILQHSQLSIPNTVAPPTTMKHKTWLPVRHTDRSVHIAGRGHIQTHTPTTIPTNADHQSGTCTHPPPKRPTNADRRSGTQTQTHTRLQDPQMQIAGRGHIRRHTPRLQDPELQIAGRGHRHRHTPHLQDPQTQIAGRGHRHRHTLPTRPTMQIE